MVIVRVAMALVIELPLAVPVKVSVKHEFDPVPFTVLPLWVMFKFVWPEAPPYWLHMVGPPICWVLKFPVIALPHPKRIADATKVVVKAEMLVKIFEFFIIIYKVSQR